MEIIENPGKLRMYNDVLIHAQSETEEFIKTKNLTLHKNIVTQKSEDAFFHKQKGKRIHGTVVAIPYKIRPSRIHQTNSLTPKAHQSFSGDVIGLQVHAYKAAIRRELQEKELKVFMDKYRSSPWEAEFTRNDEQEILCGPGDTAWFHYLALSQDSYMGQDNDNKRYYRVPYESIFCFVTTENEVHMVNGYVQVEQYWSKDFMEIDVDGVKVMGKLKGNLVVELKDKPELQTGVVVCKGKDLGIDSRPSVVAGDVILYRKKAEFINKIQGQEVLLMQQWQIIAKKVDMKFLPVGNYVMLRITKIPEKKIIHMNMIKRQVAGLMMEEIEFKKDLRSLIEDIAYVVAVGENCEFVKADTRVFFNVDAEVFNIADTLFIKEGDIMAEILKPMTEDEIMADAMESLIEWESEVASHNDKILKGINYKSEDFIRLVDDCRITDKMEWVEKPTFKAEYDPDTYGPFTLAYVDQWSVGDSGDSFAGFMYVKVKTKDKYLKIPYDC